MKKENGFNLYSVNQTVRVGYSNYKSNVCVCKKSKNKIIIINKFNPVGSGQKSMSINRISFSCIAILSVQSILIVLHFPQTEISHVTFQHLHINSKFPFAKDSFSIILHF